jgi:hypothetical protein
MEQAGVDEVTNMETGCFKALVHITDRRSCRRHRQDYHADSPDCVPYRLVGYHLLPADPVRYADDIRSYPMGFLSFTEMGRCMGEMAYTLSDCPFLRSMLYFVGFYVLLLFDIVLCIQVENLEAITQSEQTMAAYLQNSFFSAGYLMAASIVALKCLNLVPRPCRMDDT